MVYTYAIKGVSVKTGDIIITHDGDDCSIAGQFWRILGALLPGDADHAVIYIGPEGRCIESAACGVEVFNVPNGTWDGQAMMGQRGLLLDEFYGVVSPLEGIGLGPEDEKRVREDIAAYCLAQAGAHKPYNLNFFDPETEDSFYCTQLAYKAYQRHGVNLNTGLGIPDVPCSSAIIFPQEIWDGFPHRRPSAK